MAEYFVMTGKQSATYRSALAQLVNAAHDVRQLREEVHEEYGTIEAKIIALVQDLRSIYARLAAREDGTAR